MRIGTSQAALLLTSIFLLFFAATSEAITVSDYSSGMAANGIGKTRHNMGSLGRVITTDATSQICVFCHTPHHTNTANGLAPLWNRVNSVSTYTAYGSTIGGTVVEDGDVGSTTLACLSCHDGVTTFDNLVNRPGKDTIGGDPGWAFNMPNFKAGVSFIPLSFFINADHFDPSASGPCYFCHVDLGASGGDEAGRLNIGMSLMDDHPVSIPYTEGTASLRTTDTVIAQIDLASGLGSTNANVMQNLWAVKGFFNSGATISDLLRDNPNAGGMTVECSSCHDPHFKNESWDEVEHTWYSSGVWTGPWCTSNEDCSDGMFLRRVGGNSGSGVCRTCHNK
jgi:hypothetical protein